MKRALLLLVFGIFISGHVKGQIKIGDNPQNIDASSVLELESNSRVLVITRINTEQMNAIVPSAGAIVYNTDLQCIHYYDGAQWINVCEEVGGIPNLTTDPLINTNSTIVITPNGENNHIEVAPNSIRTEQIVDGGINGDDIQDNSIGQSKIGNDAVGRNEIAENAVGLEALDTDQITLSNFNNTPGFITGAEIVSSTPGNAITDNGGAFYSDQGLQNDISTNTSSIVANTNNIQINTNDIALKEDAVNKSDNTALGNSPILFPTQNAVKTYVDTQLGTISTDDDITDVTFDGTNLTVDEGLTTFSANLSALEESADIIANTNLINNHIANDDIDDTNERITTAILDASNQLIITEPGNTTTVNLNALAGTGTDNQNIQGSAFVGNTLTIGIQNGTSEDVDLSDLEESADITANTALINGHITADGDLDDTNEVISTAILSGTDLVITEAGTPFTVDLSTLAGTGTDSQDIQGSAFAGNTLTIGIQNGTSEDVDLSALEESADITANTTLINGHITADGDLDDTNEVISTAILSGTDLVITEAGTPFTVDLSTLAGTGTDSQNIQGSAFAGNTLTIGIQNGNSEDVDLSALEESADITANTTLINGHITADGDLDDTNEIELPLGGDSGQVLSTNGAGIYSWATVTGGGIDTNNFITGGNLTVTTLNLTGTGAAGASIDVSALDDSAAIALKEDSANKSTDVALGASDVLFPSQNAVKTYVDGLVATVSDDDVTGVTLNGASLLTIDEGTTSINVDLSALEESAVIATVQADVDANETAANTAIALKEDSANKSTDVALGASDVLFPSQNAVKTYVDGLVATVSDDDVTGVTLNGASLLTIDEGTTSINVDLSVLEESAAIATVQADVDANETAANTAIALKEDSANKSTDVALGASDVLFPSQNAVKTYVDGLVATVSDDDVTGVTLNGASLLTIDEGTTSINVDLSALEESAVIATVQADVDANETAANTAIALKEDSANKSNDGTLTDNSAVDFPTEQAVKTYVDTEIAAAAADDDITAASLDGAGVLTIDEGTTQVTVDLSPLEESAVIATVQADVDANETAANTAIALKEDSANKSNDGTLTDNSAVDFPTEQAVKTYVDTEIAAAAADDDITAASLDGAGVLTIDEGTTQVTVDLSPLEESAVIATVQADVDANETAANTAIALKEDSANKSNDGTLTDNSAVDFPTEQAVKTYVDTEIAAAAADDDITAASLDGAGVLTIDEGTTQVTVDLSPLEESAAIATVQADVDANETAANTAIALKEDSANKSNDGTLTDNSAVDFPTEQAVKTYVDTEIAGVSAGNNLSNTNLTQTGGINRSYNMNGQDLGFFNGGNFGIGTATPLDRLDVSGGSIRARGGFRANTGSGASLPGYSFFDDPDTGMYRSGPNLLGLSTGGTEALRIDASQNVGIGIAPTEKLHVDGNILATGTLAAGNTTITGTLGITGQTIINVGATSTALPTNRGAVNQVLTTDGAGTATWTTPAASSIPTGTSGALFFSDGAGGLNDDPTNLFWDDTNDRLGIGTNSPDRALEVVGETRSTSFATPGGSFALPGYGFSTNNDFDTGMFRAGNNQVGFSTDGIEAMRIDASQNVGIGPTFASGTTIAARLHVDGDIRAEGAITASGTIIGGIPDYVFQKYFTNYSVLDPSYIFNDLSNIENFIKANYHLPGILSAEDIKKQGFWDLGEASKLNLEKIEELFLHTIEQEKKINQLKGENEVLNKELAALKSDIDLIKQLLLAKSKGTN